MTNERKDEAPAASAEEWPKRAPPTIDLDASEVSGDTRAARGMNKARAFMRGVGDRMAGLGSRSGGALSLFVAPLSGALAALLVLAAFWAGGLIGSPQPAPPSVAPAQFDNVAANVGDLTARLARVEASAAKSATPVADPALAARADALDKSLAAVRDEAGRMSAQLRSLAASLNELKAAPRDGATAPAPDLGPLNERLARLEDATRALSSELAKPSAASADDINVRRLVLANTLDAAVRRGEPFPSALAAAKQAAANPAALAPLDAFATAGVPSEQALLRDIVAVLTRVADANAAKQKQQSGTGAEKPAAGGGVLGRLQSGLAKLVRIERDDTPAAKETPAPAGALMTALRRDDLVAARRDVARLPQAADPQIQAWIKAVDAREAALSASQKFSAEALAALAKSGQ